jgi:hypothetical protein
MRCILEFLGSHSIDGLHVVNTLWTCRTIPVFHKNLLSPFQRYISKDWLPWSRLCIILEECVTSIFSMPWWWRLCDSDLHFDRPYVLSQPRILEVTCSLLWEPQVSNLLKFFWRELLLLCMFIDRIFYQLILWNWQKQQFMLYNVPVLRHLHIC